jgi:SAM-dependent methyltransferase
MSIRSVYYNEHYAALERDRRSTIDKVLRVFQFPEGQVLRVLDVGCGPGTVSKDLVGAGHEVHGLDIAAAAVDEAQKNGIRALAFDLDSGNPFPFPDGYFDVVMALDVLEHLFDPVRVAREIARVLADDGTFIVVFPNHFDLFNRLRILGGRGIVYWDHIGLSNAWDYFHIRFFTLNDVRAFLEYCGLFPCAVQLSFIPYGHLRFVRYLMRLPDRWKVHLLRKNPDVFSGKFVLAARKSRPQQERQIVLPFTPMGL